MKCNILVLIILFFLLSCSAGQDGEDGKILISANWTSDIQSIDLSNILKNPPTIYYPNNYYEGKPNIMSNVYWMSNNVIYYYPIQVPQIDFGEDGKINGEDGKDGDDKLRRLFFSGNVVLFETISGRSISKNAEKLDSIIILDQKKTKRGVMKKTLNQ